MRKYLSTYELSRIHAVYPTSQSLQAINSGQQATTAYPKCHRMAAFQSNCIVILFQLLWLVFLPENSCVISLWFTTLLWETLPSLGTSFCILGSREA